MDIFEILGGRKFLIAVVSLIGNIVLVSQSLIDPGVYATVSIAVISAYITGNVVQKNTPPTTPTKP